MEAILGLNTALSGRYVVDREIGAGGMATVYLARDLRHDRLVALKVLRPELGAVLGLERFLSEIKVTANLQHPNLLPLFDSGEASGLLFYVMPYVDGETLRARLEREKQLPVDEVVRIAVAIANALDYAHSHNVIHRDLKPENILLQAGQPVIADFGIALAVSNAGGSRITQTGLSLGTPQYMSPEQATGDRVVDGRSDIYSLAAVTYEMLTGEAPHTGSTAQAIIARLLTDKPRSIRSTRSAVPEHIEATLEHALEKLPADRFSTAREFADSLLGRSTPATARTAALASASRGGWRARLRDPLVVGLAIGVVALGAYAASRGRDTAAGGAALAPVRFAITLPDSVRLENGIPWPGAVSPDGSAFVFSASTGGSAPAFWIRRTDQLEPRIIPGTQGGGQPIFSPDGQWIAYEAGSKLFKVRLDGSAPVAVTTASANNGADWSAKDVIVLGNEGKIHGLSTVSSAGGNLTPLTIPDTATGELDHLWPVVAPDGNTVVFAIWRGALVTSELAVTRLDNGRVLPLDIKAIRPLALVEGQLIYVQADGAVMAVPFDAGERRVTGKPVPVHDPVPVASASNGNSGIFVGQGGAPITAAGGTVSQLAWQSRASAPAVITPERRDFSEPRLSPDGRLIALTIDDGANSAVWLYDISTSTMSKLTSSERASSPAWLPDGRAVAYFALDGEGRPALFTQSVDGGSAPQRVGAVARTGTGLTVSPDGRTFLYSEIRSSSWDIMQVTVQDGKSSTVTPYLATLPFEANPQFSPDGRWVSLSSGESDRLEVVVRSFPDPRVRVQVSVNGGTEPRWSRDGSRLIYRTGDRFISARVNGSAGFVVLGRDTLPAGPPLLLGSALTTNYDVSPDGSRLLVLSSGRTLLQLVGVPNWATELRARLSANSTR